MNEKELREAAADLRRKAAQARAKGFTGLAEDNGADFLERQADQIKAEREAAQETAKSMEYFGSKKWFEAVKERPF